MAQFAFEPKLSIVMRRAPVNEFIVHYAKRDNDVLPALLILSALRKKSS